VSIVWSCSRWKTIRAASKLWILACFDVSRDILTSLETPSRSVCLAIQTAAVDRAGTITTTSVSWLCFSGFNCAGSEGWCAGSRWTGSSSSTGGSWPDGAEGGSRLIGKGSYLRTSPTVWTSRCGYPIRATSKVWFNAWFCRLWLLFCHLIGPKTTGKTWTLSGRHLVWTTSKGRDVAVRNLSRCFLNNFNISWASFFKQSCSQSEYQLAIITF